MWPISWIPKQKEQLQKVCFDLSRNTPVNTLKDLVDRDPSLQPTPLETLTQNLEDVDFLDADSLMATLFDNHHTHTGMEQHIQTKGGSQLQRKT